MAKPKKKDNTLIKNRKAFHDYLILDRFEAGIELKGTQVKTCRAHNISLSDTYARDEKGELILYNEHISTYDH
ncbi:MAG TPA: SsrA-binding protein, partial [Victivallales bacterium]|nr:SsrA-binding protein [Victivallales bacterium]